MGRPAKETAWPAPDEPARAAALSGESVAGGDRAGSGRQAPPTALPDSLGQGAPLLRKDTRFSRLPKGHSVAAAARWQRSRASTGPRRPFGAGAPPTLEGGRPQQSPREPGQGAAASPAPSADQGRFGSRHRGPLRHPRHGRGGADG
eukprot:7463356-Pyramimonas_sp.AAC.1